MRTIFRTRHLFLTNCQAIESSLKFSSQSLTLMSATMSSTGGFLVTSYFGFFPNCRQKFLEIDFLLEKLSREAPIYIVMEGNEPPFFTRFFSWDSAKSAVRILC